MFSKLTYVNVSDWGWNNLLTVTVTITIQQWEQQPQIVAETHQYSTYSTHTHNSYSTFQLTCWRPARIVMTLSLFTKDAWWYSTSVNPLPPYDRQMIFNRLAVVYKHTYLDKPVLNKEPGAMLLCFLQHWSSTFGLCSLKHEFKPTVCWVEKMRWLLDHIT